MTGSLLLGCLYTSTLQAYIRLMISPNGHIWTVLILAGCIPAPSQMQACRHQHCRHLICLFREADGRSDRRAQGRQRGRQNRPGRGPPPAAAGSAEAQSSGMVMIDDDLGMSSAPFPDLLAGPRASGSAPPSRAVSMLPSACAQVLMHLKC